MLERIDYIEKNGEASIYRCYGDGARQELPDMIRGMKVTELCDHCFASSPSVRVDENQIRTIYREEWEREDMPVLSDRAEVHDSDLKALCGPMLQEIVLPRYLKRTGDYVFYGCINLKEIFFPAAFISLGGGAFVACNHLETLRFAIDGYDPEKGNSTPYEMKSILSELSYEVEVIVEDTEGNTLYRLMFPEYGEETEDMYEARLIWIHYRGEGMKFRNCFRGRQLDFRQYDSLFYTHSEWAFIPSVMRLAFDRLRYPVELGESEKNDYLSYMQKEYQATADYIFEPQREVRQGDLRVLCSMEYFTEEILTHFLDRASAAHDAAAVTLLMEYRRKHFAVQKRKYEF